MIPGFDEYPEDSVRHAAASGGREAILRVLRDRVASRIDDFPEDGSDRDYVALVKQLGDLAEQLAILGSENQENDLDRARRERSELRAEVFDLDATGEGPRYRRRGAQSNS